MVLEMIQDLRKGTEEQTNKIHNMLNRELKNVTNKKAVQNTEKVRQRQHRKSHRPVPLMSTDAKILNKILTNRF